MPKLKRMPKVYNKRENHPKDAVYIGRPSKWGNPFIIGRHGGRDEVISKYEEYLRNIPELVKAVKEELEGRDLVCWCAPEACHGDVLLKIANEE